MGSIPASYRPILAITMGDPAGIGPEVTLKALAERDVYDWCRPLVIGDTRILRRDMEALGEPAVRLRTVGGVDDAGFQAGVVDVLDLGNAAPRDCPWGEVTAAAGRAAVEYVLRGIDLALAGEVDAIVTAPLNKAAIQSAGFRWAGHTELLAERTGSDKVTMMLTSREMRVLHVSTHVSLREALARVTEQRVLEVIHLAQQGLSSLGIARPHIAVAGLNPHAGEGGLFGDEEREIIAPAIERARAEGLMVTGPLPPDTIFWRARKGEFDGVVAMYHDQGHIPMKLLGFDQGVNVSIGLPIIRTSVDHGTAFDIAGQGIARHESMIEALRVAARMSQARQRTAK